MCILSVFVTYYIKEERNGGISMVQLIYLMAAAENHKRMTETKRVMSGTLRTKALQKEDKRLKGQ